MKLKVTINSFSYKRAIPKDPTENGGGFIFDCRTIHNPGRYDEYKNLSGKDPKVIRFFEDEPEMHEFMQHVYALTGMAVKKYLSRNFTHLMVSFGCTGGQHRSVYCAEQLGTYLKDNFDVIISVNHIEQEILKKDIR